MILVIYLTKDSISWLDLDLKCLGKADSFLRDVDNLEFFMVTYAMGKKITWQCSGVFSHALYTISHHLYLFLCA